MPEQIEKRTRNSKTHSLGGRKFSWDGTIGSIHYEDNGWQEIDNYFEPAVAPWDWQMLHAGYHIRVKEDFTTGQILQFEVQGETVQFQPMALEWTNDLDQIQPISMPQNVTPVITNPEVDLLPAVGMPSHQGTIRWNDAYGQGIDFEWKATSTRLLKILEIENLNKLPVPEQYILDGGNPVLRLNLIFDPSSGADIYVDGEVWNKQVKKQTFNIIEFVKDGEVLWGFMPLRYWGSGETEDNEGQSIATLEKRGNKLYISIRVLYDWLQSAVYPVFIDTDVEDTIDASGDDTSSRSVTWGPYTNYFYWPYATGDYYLGFLRFVINVPDDATADNGCYLQVFSYGSTQAGTVVQMQATDEDDAVDFIASNPYGRSMSGSTVDWTLPAAADEEAMQSPEIKAIIQDFFDRVNYQQNYHIVIRGSFVSGIPERVFQFDGGASFAAKLHIVYTVGAAEGQPYISRVQGVQGMRSYGGI